VDINFDWFRYVKFFHGSWDFDNCENAFITKKERSKETDQISSGIEGLDSLIPLQVNFSDRKAIVS